MQPYLLIIIFVLSTIIGYFLINNVPSLLHTPLMSGMNALSGITILGALTVTAALLRDINPLASSLLGGVAIVGATINVVGGFMVTDRMLGMFKKETVNEDD